MGTSANHYPLLISPKNGLVLKTVSNLEQLKKQDRFLFFPSKQSTRTSPKLAPKYILVLEVV